MLADKHKIVATSVKIRKARGSNLTVVMTQCSVRLKPNVFLGPNPNKVSHINVINHGFGVFERSWREYAESSGKSTPYFPFGLTVLSSNLNRPTFVGTAYLTRNSGGPSASGAALGPRRVLRFLAEHKNAVERYDPLGSAPRLRSVVSHRLA
jgi:hypothetical protein